MQIRKYYHLQDGLKDLTDRFPSQQSTVMESSYSAHFLNVTSYVLASNWKKTFACQSWNVNNPPIH